MPVMNQKNAGLGSAALDLGLGDQLKVQVDDQVADQKARQKRQKPMEQQFGNVAQDLLGSYPGMGLSA